jgi:hypothetical protein
MNNEEWVELPTELTLSRYLISSFGNIKNKKSGKLLKLTPRSDGYINIGLILDDRSRKWFFIHRLVLISFLGYNDNCNMTADHINRQKSDNRLMNLRWATHSQQNLNKDHMINNGNTIRIIKYDSERNLIRRYNSIKDASIDCNISTNSIIACLKKRTELCKNFIFEYDLFSFESEVWRPVDIETIKPIYHISNFGRLKIIKENNERILNCRKSNIYVSTTLLTKDNKTVDFYLHRLVAMHFIENPSNYDYVNHKDCNKHNNVVENLEWITAKSNMEHAVNNNLIHNNKPILYESKIYPSLQNASVSLNISRNKLRKFIIKE